MKYSPKIAILGEHDSDVATIKVLVRRLVENPALPVRSKGFDGGGNLLNQGARHLQVFAGLGITKFIVCHDADGPDPTAIRKRIEATVIQRSGLSKSCCIVIPVQELEAWILADIEKVVRLFPGWKPKAIRNPESVPYPKEHLEKLSRDPKNKARYIHSVHNEKVAEHLDLSQVISKCPSFRPLLDCVANNGQRLSGKRA